MRADKIVNPIESLTPEEKERLGFLIMWALDGPEQGMCTKNGWFRCQLELHEFCRKNSIPAGGLWLHRAQAEITDGI